MTQNSRTTTGESNRSEKHYSPADTLPDNFLGIEFEYIAQTAFQANEDRARVTNLYLVTIASLFAVLFSNQLDASSLPPAYWGFSLLFTVLGIASILTLLQLVRLREAWVQSIAAMNQIKDFYVKKYRHSNVDIKPAFAWSTGTIPKKFKPWSVSFLLALQVSLIGGIAFGTALFFAGMAYANSLWWTSALVLGIVTCGIQLILYWRLLTE